jgi:hypothetical protein
LEGSVVVRVLSEGGELREAGPHAPRQSVLRGIVRPRILVGLGRITRKVIPYAVKVDALSALNEALRLGTMK